MVAELVPAGSAPARAHEGLAALVRRGSVTLGAPNSPDAYPRMRRVLPPGSARRLLDQVRGSR